MGDLFQAHVDSLVLDATPLITQPYTHYQHYAKAFYTTPTVLHEIKDERARENLKIWESIGSLKLRHPKKESVERVSNFARLTGDYSVLSANDIHIIALTYELEIELNGGDWRLRKTPGEDVEKGDAREAADAAETTDVAETADERPRDAKKKRRRGGKKQREKRIAAEIADGAKADEMFNRKVDLELEQPATNEAFEAEPQVAGNDEQKEDNDYYDDDDGEWITPENLTEAMIKDSGEDTTGMLVGDDSADPMKRLDLPQNKVALATGDFAVQNVALQMNLNLMNFMSGLRIKKLRNYMLRCHACFKLIPIPRDGKAKHFCPSCGGYSTLLRCAVSVDATTGDIVPHLKANFQWTNRGNKYSIASPLSKNSQKRAGNKGFVHTKHAQDVALLREDQKEYVQALKQEDWTRRHNEKVLDDWIGGGSADNFVSPFAISGLKHHSVRVGRGRYANSSRKKK
ncbi:LAMI_0E12486g1_1 [Lachancea mirantina]|uniref:20S-pre-rRNA D-site endonuclease NOB1 n=1 Tax=Lachancea mirantina TaxID=1230905 RepID=A0A1G4JQ29_9SACH|nr:LAMI_0E12486g1_1 [Lachancea mirantina]